MAAAAAAVVAGNGGGGSGSGRRGSPPPEPPPGRGRSVSPAEGSGGAEESVSGGEQEGARYLHVPEGEDAAAPITDGRESGEVGRGGGIVSEEDGSGGKHDDGRTSGKGGEECAGRSGGGQRMRVKEVTDLFRTGKGLKCTLSEAYACCFDRAEEVRACVCVYVCVCVCVLDACVTDLKPITYFVSPWVPPSRNHEIPSPC